MERNFTVSERSFNIPLTKRKKFSDGEENTSWLNRIECCYFTTLKICYYEF